MDLSTLLLHRQLGSGRGVGPRSGEIAYHKSLVRRLKQSKSLQNSSAAAVATWCREFSTLACVGEDCTLRLWDADSGALVQSFDPVSGSVHGQQACMRSTVWCPS